MIDVSDPATWPRNLRNMAIEALSREHVHGSRANRLISAGLAVNLHGRCVLKLPVRDALRSYMEPRAAIAAQRKEG